MTHSGVTVSLVIANHLQYSAGDSGISSPAGDSRVHSDGVHRQSLCDKRPRQCKTSSLLPRCSRDLLTFLKHASHICIQTLAQNQTAVRSQDHASLHLAILKGKLEVLHEHYGKLGTASVDDQFDDSWREHVENKVTEYSEMSSARKDKVLDRDISYAEIKSV